MASRHNNIRESLKEEQKWFNRFNNNINNNNNNNNNNVMLMINYIFHRMLTCF